MGHGFKVVGEYAHPTFLPWRSWRLGGSMISVADGQEIFSAEEEIGG
jgi:hypothetical protein